ncbi:hypothetical protein AGMMS49965_04040 [Bacteroidia bacterium]|nr:hypothetical protein AGMMS49965_04040 [Bacteroidia bacterium]
MKIKLVENTLALRRSGATYSEAFAYFWKGAVRELYHKKKFKWKWLKRDGTLTYFDFNGAKLPDISHLSEDFFLLLVVFEDTFLVSCLHQDNYDKKVVLPLDKIMREGPYGYVDGTFDVTVKKGDVVIDAGAWIGDFSAYAASKGAIAYAFEPIEETYRWLCKTRDLNTEGQIHPIKKGLGSSECELKMTLVAGNSMANRAHNEDDNGVSSEKVKITTLDKFVEENKLTRVDFIKSDIEGAERDMLRGATKVLQKFAPKLAICTYHLPDDPEVLEKIILDANPKYKVVHLRHKLMAAVV